MAASSQRPVGFQIPQTMQLFTLLIQSQEEDPGLRACGWEDLKFNAPVGPLDLSLKMREIESNVVKDGRSLVDCVDELFKQFAEALSPEFESTKLDGEEFKVTELHLTALQARLRARYENEALETIWNRALLQRFTNEGAFEHVAAPVGHEAIRAWLTNDQNAQRVQQIENLNLSNFGLKALPPEIGLFTGLRELNLEGNQYGGGGNQIRCLPDSIGNLTNLRHLSLSHNQLYWLPDSIGSLKNLTHLNLSYNRLDYLPNTIGSMENLRELSLSYNELTNFPAEIGNLSALTSLSADRNQLSNLSESFVRLTNLEDLHLSNNQLTAFPDQEFTKLRNIDLSSNQLTLLPEWVWKLEGGVKNQLNNNPLMIYGYKTLNKKCWFGQMHYTGRGRYYLTNESEQIRDLWKSLKSYHPLSPLSAFYKAVACQHPLEDVHRAYQNLNPEMQHRICSLVLSKIDYIPDYNYMACSSSSGSSSEEARLLKFDKLVEDRALFDRSVRQAVYEKFEQFGPEEKKRVYYHVWDLAGKPESDLALGDEYENGHADRCYTKFLGLTEAEKEAVYYQIWDLNGQPAGVPDYGKDHLFSKEEIFCDAVEKATGCNDPHWGQNHAEDHVLRFIDALERATSQ